VNNEDPFAKYKDLYRDIIFGYTSDRLECNKRRVYVKHFTDLESGRSERFYKECVDLARERGLKTEEESVDFLIEEDLWSKDNENRIKELKEKISHLKSSKEKLIIKSQLSLIEKEIKPYEDELYLLNHERSENIGITAEVFANKKVSESTIRKSFFRDPELKEPFYTEEEYDYIDQTEVNQGIEIYTNMLATKFAGDEIKRVSVCPFFMNTYYLCEDNAYYFFGKPVLYLTNFQIALMSYAKNFKYLMSNNKPAPEDYQKHPDRIIEWYDMQSKTANADDYGDKGEASGRSYFGANKDELKAIQKEGEGEMNLTEEVKKQGGEMNFDQILKMHGL
jgi:uncharacterized protein YneR